MSQEMKAFSGMKTTRNFSFSHSEVIINSTPGRKVVLESTLLEQSPIEKGCGDTSSQVWKATPAESRTRPVYNEIWYT